MTAVARAGSLALSLLAAWGFFHLLPGAVRLASGEWQDASHLLQSGMGMDVGDE